MNKINKTVSIKEYNGIIRDYVRLRLDYMRVVLENNKLKKELKKKEVVTNEKSFR